MARKLFDAKIARDFGLQPLPETPDGPLVSVPERALLELLAEVGARQGIEEAKNIMEGLRSPRMDVLGPLLEHCPRVKVVRLCVQWAEEMKLEWAAEARRSARSGPVAQPHARRQHPHPETLMDKSYVDTVRLLLEAAPRCFARTHEVLYSRDIDLARPLRMNSSAWR